MIPCFGGVGAVIAYSDSGEAERVDAVSTSEILSTEVGLKFEMNFIVVALGLQLATDIGYAGEREKSSSIETSTVVARSRSFALGDPDDGDVFDVQVSWYSFIRNVPCH